MWLRRKCSRAARTLGHLPKRNSEQRHDSKGTIQTFVIPTRVYAKPSKL